MPITHRLSRFAVRVTAFVMCLSAASVGAQPAPRQLVEQTIEEAFAVLRNPELQSKSKERLRALRTAVDKAFDWEAMAKSSLGAPWRSLSEVQRKDFIEVFRELLAQRYMDDIDRFEGSEQLSVTGAVQDGNIATVRTVLLTSSREKIPIDYTLYLSKAGWRVDDVSIEGVSLVNHYRKTFSQFLANKSFDELMQQLRRKLGLAAAKAATPSAP
jgi:phospholipid transport system substrate-binding protein